MSEVVDTYFVGPLRLQLLKAISGCAEHPTVSLTAPARTVILGGGAFVDWDGPCSPPNSAGNLLTAMHPDNSGTTWVVASKDHIDVSVARIIAYAIVAQMQDGTPIPAGAYQIVSGTSAVAAHPTLQVDLPAGYIAVGGGARVNYTGVGNMLYESYPVTGLGGWVASGKDHLQSDPASITVWAIGLSTSFLGQYGLHVSSYNSTSSPIANHPRQTFVIPNFRLTGAGARDNWSGVGNLLTASFPSDRQTVVAEGKDHIQEDPSTITAYAIGFLGEL